MKCNLRVKYIDDYGEIEENEECVECCEFLLDYEIIELVLIIFYDELYISKKKFIEYYNLMEDLFQGCTDIHEYDDKYEIEFYESDYESKIQLLGHLGSLRYVQYGEEIDYYIIPKKFLELKKNYAHHEAYVYAHLYFKCNGTFTTVGYEIIKSIHEINLQSELVHRLFCEYIDFFKFETDYFKVDSDLKYIYSTPKLEDKLKRMEAYVNRDKYRK